MATEMKLFTFGAYADFRITGMVVYIMYYVADSKIMRYKMSSRIILKLNYRQCLTYIYAN